MKVSTLKGLFLSSLLGCVMACVPMLVHSASEPQPSPLFKKGLKLAVETMTTMASPVAAPAARQNASSCIYQLFCATGNQDTIQSLGLLPGIERSMGGCADTAHDCVRFIITQSGSLCLQWVWLRCDSTSVGEVPFPKVYDCECDSLATMTGNATCGNTCRSMTCNGSVCCPGYWIATMSCGNPTCGPTCGVGPTCTGHPSCVGSQTFCAEPSCQGAQTCTGTGTCNQTCSGLATCSPNVSCAPFLTCTSETCSGALTCLGSLTCPGTMSCSNYTCTDAATCYAPATCQNSGPTCHNENTCLGHVTCGQASCTTTETCQIQTCPSQTTCAGFSTCSGATCNIATCAGLATCDAQAGCSLCSCPKQGDLNGNGTLDIADLLGIIGRVYFDDTPARHDPNCPHSDRADVSCDGEHTILDIVLWVDKVWRKIPNAICDPCTHAGSR